MKKIFTVCALALSASIMFSACDGTNNSVTDGEIPTSDITVTAEDTSAEETSTEIVTTTEETTTVQTSVSVEATVTTTPETTEETTTAAETTITEETTTTVATTTTAATTTTVATTTTAAATTTAPQLIIPSDLAPTANDILAYTNACRKQAQSPELATNAYLSNAAQTRANELASSYSHTRPDGREYSTVLTDYNIKGWFRDFGENIAVWDPGKTGASVDSQYIVGLWMNSTAGHRENMLKATYTHVGIGVAKGSDGKYYFVQEFGQTKNGVTI